MSDYKVLSSDFIAELVKACLVDSKILNICKQHLKYQYLENEAQKKVIKYLFDFNDVNINQVPTVGMIGQAFSTDKDALKFLNNVKKSEITNEIKDSLLSTLEDWLKKRRLIILHQLKFPEMFNGGNQEEAMTYLAQESTDIVNFALKDQYYNKIFEDFEDRQQKRKVKTRDQYIREKCPFGIHELDDIIHGGGSKGTSALILARSGVGKTTMARWSAIVNARLGRRVVCFFGEGTKEEHEDGFDAAWTGVSLREMEFGDISENYNDIVKARNFIMESGGEIIIIVSESFDSMYIDDCYEILKDIERTIGKVDMAVFDYMEVFNTKGKYSNTESGERKRRLDIANKITNIATSMKLFSLAFTQANDIKIEKWNNPEYVLTRSDISEFKGAIKPFSYFITMNQTIDEKKNEIIRLYCEKFRKYPDGQIIKIYQSRGNGRFYDSRKTLESFYTKI